MIPALVVIAAAAGCSAFVLWVERYTWCRYGYCPACDREAAESEEWA